MESSRRFAFLCDGGTLLRCGDMFAIVALCVLAVVV